MEQLSGLDSLFLYAENDNVHQHVSAFGVYDTTGLPGGTMRFRDLLAHFERRLSPSKLFRRRLVTVPHELDRPYWIEDADLDIEFHVRHIALPYPGDRRQLMIQLARLHSRALDLSKPLWEIYVIEGLENVEGLPPGSFAIFLKVHHAAMDTSDALRIVGDIHASASAPSGSHAHDAQNEVIVSEREPLPLALYGHVLGHGVKRSVRTARLYSRLLVRASKFGAQHLADRLRGRPASSQRPLYQAAPHTRFNRTVGPNRVIDAVQLPLARIRALRQQVGRVSIDEVYLAIVSGALRHYLREKNELPDESLRALFSLRMAHQEQPSARANRIPLSLRTELRDPLARLLSLHEEIQNLHHDPMSALSQDLLPELLSEIPHVATHAFLQKFLFSQVNCIVSNLRGPDEPMYLAGARTLQFCPIGMLAQNIGLHVSGFSYDGHLTIAFTACRAILPDPAHFASALLESFDELCVAVAKRAASTERRKAGRTQRRSGLAGQGEETTVETAAGAGPETNEPTLAAA